MNMHIRRSDDQGTIPSLEASGVRRLGRNRFLTGSTIPKVSLIIPAKNEALNLPWVLERIPEMVSEVILVDGNSTDDTVEVVKTLRPDAIILQQLANGKGSALVTGLLAATGDIIVMIDADGSMDPIEIHGLVGSLLSGADVVKSSRYVAGGGSDDISHLRNFGNQGLRIVSKILFGHDWSELAYGYAAFWKDVIPSLHLEPIVNEGNPESKKEYGRGFEIETLLFTRAHKIGLKVSEVFSFEYPRIHGVSNLSTFKDGWRVLTCMFRERLTVLPRNPNKVSPVMIVGSGTKFLSGISHYTAHLANAFSEKRETSVILMRNLIPKFLYPGKTRIGNSDLTNVKFRDNIAVYDGVDWNRGKSLKGAKRFIKNTHPSHVIFQWWTGAVFLNYLSLAKTALKADSKVILEFHELQDVGESKIPLTSRLTRWTVRKLLRMSSSFIIHSSQDLKIINQVYPETKEMNYQVIPHGPYDDLVEILESEPIKQNKHKKEDVLKIMFFGVLREYKGLNVLSDAINLLDAEGFKYQLHIVGEPWESKTVNIVENMAKKKNVRFTGRYVQDGEVPYLLKETDVLVLPYLRSSASGPIALAMAAGMPLVTTDLESLKEATEGYSGAVHVKVNDASMLAKGIKQASKLLGKKHYNPLSWNVLIKKYEDLTK
jgi:glycosyltransferase involved in cell wall biosynthesis